MLLLLSPSRGKGRAACRFLRRRIHQMIMLPVFRFPFEPALLILLKLERVQASLCRFADHMHALFACSSAFLVRFTLITACRMQFDAHSQRVQQFSGAKLCTLICRFRILSLFRIRNFAQILVGSRCRAIALFLMLRPTCLEAK